MSQISSTGFGLRQQTLKSPISCIGTGLHSGRRVRLSMLPAAPDSGILFRRTDLGIEIPARYDHVVDTRLCTALGLPDDPETRIGTVEHLMAALAAMGIDNALLEVDGPEVPVFDGSANSFVFLIDCAGRVEQNAARRMIEVLRPVRVGGESCQAELLPATTGLELFMSIDFSASAIGCQAMAVTLSEASFRRELVEARTFALATEVAQLQANGLALGGSLENAVVVDEARILNPGGLRMRDEFVRHKLTDAVGDLALAGASLRGRFVGHRSGHTQNNALLRALFADRSNWRWATPMAATGQAGAKLPAAAAPA